MKKIFETGNAFEAQLIQDQLQAAGIEAMVRDTHAQGLIRVSVWILHDDQKDKALEVLQGAR